MKDWVYAKLEILRDAKPQAARVEELHTHVNDPDVTSSCLSDRSMVVDGYVYQISCYCYCCCVFGVNNVFRKTSFPATNREAPLDPHASEDVWWTVSVFLIAFQPCISFSKTATSLSCVLPWSLPDLIPVTFVLTFVETDVQSGLRIGKQARKTAVQT